MEAADREFAAGKDLTRRIQRLRAVVIASFVALAVAGGIAGYWALRTMLLGRLGWHVPYVTAVVGTGVPFLSVMAASRWVVRGMLRVRLPAWVDELAGRHHVAPESLREYTSLWE